MVVRMAVENPTWGYTRIRDGLNHLGHEIGRTTVQRILSDHGIEPAPERKRKTPWKSFINAHLGAIVSADFFTVEVLTWSGLVRYSVLFFLDLKTRMVEIAGITPAPSGVWMKQIVRNLTDVEDGFLRDTRYLIIDRDPLYTGDFRRMLKESGVETLRLPSRSPDLNAHAERFVLSIKSECLNRIVPLGEKHLRRAVYEFASHYHSERPHQGLCGKLIAPEQTTQGAEGQLVYRDRLGGILKYYYREAA